MKIKVAILNSMYEKMFDVEFDSIYVNALVPFLIDGYNMILENGKFTKGNMFKSMKYEHFKKISDEMFI